MPFGHVLVGYDGSEASSRALERVCDLVAAGETEVTLLTVVPTKFTSLGPKPVDPGIVDDADEKLAQAYVFLEERGVRASGERALGDPADRILEEAERRGADLVVVGSHAKPLARRLRLGSVSAKVVAHARCPVLVVR